MCASVSPLLLTWTSQTFARASCLALLVSLLPGLEAVAWSGCLLVGAASAVEADAVWGVALPGASEEEAAAVA